MITIANAALSLSLPESSVYGPSSVSDIYFQEKCGQRKTHSPVNFQAVGSIERLGIST